MKASRKLFETAVRIFIRIGRKKIIDVSLPRGSSVSWVEQGKAKKCVLSAKLRSTEPGRRGSEAVALRHPVMPVANSLGSGLVGINGNQL